MNRLSLEEAAALLFGRVYGEEITPIESELFKKNSIVAVFGYSDDCMEFRGAIDDEVGPEAFIHDGKLLESQCDDMDCPYFEDLKSKAFKIEGFHGLEEDGPEWIYKTRIPHRTFLIYDGDFEYCEGIVFYTDFNE